MLGPDNSKDRAAINKGRRWQLVQVLEKGIIGTELGCVEFDMPNTHLWADAEPAGAHWSSLGWS